MTQHLALQIHIGERLSSLKIKQLNSEGLKALLAKPNVYLAAEANLSVMQSLGETIEQIEQSVLEQCRTRSSFRYLKSIPGIGPILGMTIMLETGTKAASPMPVTSPHIAGASRVKSSATANVKAAATARTAIGICHGPLSRRRSRPRALKRKLRPIISAR